MIEWLLANAVYGDSTSVFLVLLVLWFLPQILVLLLAFLLTRKDGS